MANIKKKYIAIFVSSILLLEFVFGLSLKLPITEIIQINVFLLIVFVGYYFAVVKRKRIGVITGYNFFITMWTTWLVFAWIGKYYFISNDIWTVRNSSIEFDRFFNLNIIALLCFNIAYYIGSRLPKFRTKSLKRKQSFTEKRIEKSNIDFIKINKYISLVSTVCILIDIYYYVKMGGFTMLYTGNIDEYRFDIQEESALFNYINYTIPLLMILKISAIRDGKLKGVANYVIIFLLFLMEFAYGSKMLFIFPIVVSFCLAYMDQKKDFINAKNIILILFAAIVCILYTNYRGLGQAVSNSLLADLFLFVGGEFRDAARFISFVDNGGIYIDTLRTAFLKCIPHRIRFILNVDQYIENIGTYVKTSLGYSFAGGTTRIGILAEMYTYGRATAIIICFFIFGFIIARIDKQTTDYDDIWEKTFRMIFIFQISWFLLAETYIQLPAMIIYILLYVIIRIMYKIMHKIKI